jgi:hypothetical protein
MGTLSLMPLQQKLCHKSKNASKKTLALRVMYRTS